MKFQLLDRIVEVTPGESLTAIKAVTASEEYLADHFPAFPVLPGVFMLEAMTEAAAWLVRSTLDFQPTLVLLRQARNVIYKSFVKPGHLLELQVDCRRMARDESEFAGRGTCNGREVVKARFSLSHGDLTQRGASLAEVNQAVAAHFRRQFAMLTGSPTD